MKHAFFAFLFWCLSCVPSFAEIYHCGVKEQDITIDVPKSWEYIPKEDGCRFQSDKDVTESINVQTYYNNPMSPQQVANTLINDMKEGGAKTNAGLPIKFRDYAKMNQDVSIIKAEVNNTPIMFIISKFKKSLILTTLTGKDMDKLVKIVETISGN